MLRKTAMIVAGLGCMSVLLALPAAAQDREDEWGPRQGDWDLTLTGSGSQDDDFDNGNASGSFNVGFFATDRAEFLVRQSVSYADTPGSGSDTILTTRVAFDYHFGADRFWPFLGVNFGGVYGDAVDETFAAAPEAGIKWYIKPSTFLMVMGEYQFFFKDIDDADDAFEDGQFVYTVGVGFNW
jgi:hypothetical protein